MKRLRTWAWPDPVEHGQRLRKAAWGGAYWMRAWLRKQEAAQRKAMLGMTLVPIVRVQAQAAETEAPPAPVVH